MQPSNTVISKDHLGRKVELPTQPQRIISLCPSQTATLYDLGLGDRVVGLTHFCIHPAEQVGKAVKVGGTKQLKMERIDALQPDLIIAEKEENTKEMVEALEADYPVYVTDVHDIESCLKMIRDLGEITGTQARGLELAAEVEAALNQVQALAPTQRCLYFIWRKPWMVAGRGTFIQAVLNLCGLENVIETDRYPELLPEEIVHLNPEVVLLSSEPYPFAERHIAELRALLPETKFLLVDGEMFSWYGSRMRLAPQYLNTLVEKF